MGFSLLDKMPENKFKIGEIVYISEKIRLHLGLSQRTIRIDDFNLIGDNIRRHPYYRYETQIGVHTYFFDEKELNNLDEERKKKKSNRYIK